MGLLEVAAGTAAATVGPPGGWDCQTPGTSTKALRFEENTGLNTGGRLEQMLLSFLSPLAVG